jgi:calcium-dependent protein kinase
MYVLLCGYPPFAGDTDQLILKAVKRGIYTFSTDEWRGVSKEAKVLITNMLRLNPADRITAEVALNDPWIRMNMSKSTVRMHGATEHRKIVDQFRIFRNTSRMKKVALTVIATQLSNDEVNDLRETFAALDGNGDGSLTHDEMRAAMQQHKIDLPDDLEKIMMSIDSDRSGRIDYTEFIAATLDKQTYIQEDACWAAFRVFDIDGDGVITKEELKKILTGESDVKQEHEQLEKMLGVTDTVFANMIAEVDVDGDGKIDFGEFMQMMRGREDKGLLAAVR